MEYTLDETILSSLAFDEKGLIPVVVQDNDSDQVLMMAYMNLEALEETLKTKQATYYSRKRKTLWVKGKTSGNTQTVKSLSLDCDGDTLLMKVKQKGVACHKNKLSCFHTPILKNSTKNDEEILFKLYNTVKDRYHSPKEGAYTTYLFNEGINKILKKVGEESSEVIIASKDNDNFETILEISDLMYHLMVLMVNQGIEFSSILEELKKRSQ